MSSIWEQRLAEADISDREPRRHFDVAAGLRRLAQDAGYVQAPADEPCGSRARRRLGAVTRWVVTQAGAAAHVEELTAVIGDDIDADLAPADFDGWIDEFDIHGVHVFGATLYLARHPESALFWWQLAAGAGHSGAAYCLYLYHLSVGEVREAAFWKRQAVTLFKDPTEEFFDGLESFVGYTVRHSADRAVSTRCLEEKVERLAVRHDDGGLVYRPDSRLVEGIHELAGHH
ncbi:hypothetical protein [Streptomyces sp. NPDC001787]|uniref:hypothetical protein n=1 Tax=Streptomyces sp. NPDC001787 TaxID=3154523 RepID=UPI00331CFF4D